MPVELARLVAELQPEKTILLFGAGSSIPSGAPSVKTIIDHLSAHFNEASNGFTLPEFTSLIEHNSSRRKLIAEVQILFKDIHPTGGLLNLPLYNWKNLFTTNFDELIEECYKRKGKNLTVYASNFDFTVHAAANATKLFKLHGTVTEDIATGHQSRLILTESDYDNTEEYRDYLYRQLSADLSDSHLIIIGHSLSDPDIKEIVGKAVSINQKILNPGKIVLLLYTKDENRATLFEKRGLRVCFGGIDEFFAMLAKQAPTELPLTFSLLSPIDKTPALSPITIDATHAAKAQKPNVSDMFNGWPATYADILNNLTFSRTVSEKIPEYLREDGAIAAILMGASGVGKTTAARQVLVHYMDKNAFCWEHKEDYTLPAKDWLSVARILQDSSQTGILFVDDAHKHLHEINDLIDLLSVEKNFSLKIIMCSSRAHWGHRIKTPTMYKHGKEFKLQKLAPDEISRLLYLVDTSPLIKPLVEHSFSGFSNHERKRRLEDRCEADMFVCLKNIFASEKFDDILLREYADLAYEHQEIYKIVAAMESAGIRVHRQLIIRLLGIPATEISGVLSHLRDIIHEYTISEKDGIYGWKGRHSVIAEIISRYKYSDTEKIASLFGNVIDCIMPTYEIEIRTIRELCSVDGGIGRLPDKQDQNRLLRKMMSIAPGERVPRHRLIRNLIEMGEFEKAETEIRLFEKDFRRDGPVWRYRVNLLVARATRTPGILDEDRLAILEQAKEQALIGISKYPTYKNMLTSYCDVGIEIYRRNGSLDVYDDAISKMKDAELKLGDPEISALISRYERRIAGHSINNGETTEI